VASSVGVSGFCVIRKREIMEWSVTKLAAVGLVNNVGSWEWSGSGRGLKIEGTATICGYHCCL
jgi:hypothetical protein